MATNEEIDDFIAHHGVKGMHWGVRKAARQARDQSIHDARARNTSRANEAVKQIDQMNLATTEKGRKAAAEAIKKLQDDADNSGDNKLAGQRTRGEKIATALVYGAAGATALAILRS
jgi:hypothetical protein